MLRWTPLRGIYHQPLLIFSITIQGQRIFDSDNHSFSQLPAHKALTWPKGQSAWAGAPLGLAKKTRSMQKTIKQSVPLKILLLEVQWSGICAEKEMCYTQYECVMKKPWLLLFGRVCLMWLLWCSGGSTVEQLREDEQRIVVLLVVVFSVIFVFGREPQSYLFFGRALWVGML